MNVLLKNVDILWLINYEIFKKNDRVKFSSDSGYSGDSKINIEFFGYRIYEYNV